LLVQAGCDDASYLFFFALLLGGFLVYVVWGRLVFSEAARREMAMVLLKKIDIDNNI
jgi:hypothetical protein